MGIMGIIDEFLAGKKDNTSAKKPYKQELMNIVDNTPRAKATNSLTAKDVDVDMLRKIIREAKRQGLDPYAALAEAWKETGFGTNQGVKMKNGKVVRDKNGKPMPRLPAIDIHINPLQYNAMDLAPKTKEKLPEEVLKEMSRKIFDEKVIKRIQGDDRFKAIDQNRNYAQRGADEQPEEYAARIRPDKKFDNARIDAIARPIAQDAHIEGGIGYLKKMVNKHKDLTKAFAAYRGSGDAAEYHGNHVKELYTSLKGNQAITSLVEGL